MSESRRPVIAVLATGGTIAGAEQAGSGTRYVSGMVSPDALISAVPALRSLGEIRCEQIASIGSQDMSHDIWLRLARRIGQLIDDPSIDGIVLTHGTDTLEETAYFLSLVLARIKPVVLVGAMRPSGSLSADGPLNLYDAVVLATYSAAGVPGPLTVMDGLIHEARALRKISTTGSAAFACPMRGCAGLVKNGEVTLYREGERSGSPVCPPRFKLPEGAASDWPSVAIVYVHVGMRAADLSALLAGRLEGIVLAGVGEGNAPQAVLQQLAQAAREGVAVLRTSRCAAGTVSRSGEVDDQASGFVVGRDLSPQHARIILMLALLQGTRDAAGLQRLVDAC